MSYIGNTNTTQGFIAAVDFFSGNGSTVAFTLSRPVASVAQVQATISNVPQSPGNAYTVSGNTITFTSAPPSGTNNIYVYYTSPITQVIAPGQGTVGTTQLQNGLVGNFADGSAAAPSITNDGDTNTGIFFPAADTIAFAEGGVESARIDASGNMGLGVTPNTWRSNDKAIQVGGSTDYAAIVGAGAGVVYGNNFYRDSGGFKYKNSYTAGRFDFDYTASGGFSWNIAPSGTAGNTISFTQAMTLDADGDLGIGTSSPAAPLHISRDSETQAIFNRATTTTGASFVRFTNGGGNYYLGPDNSTGNRAFSSGGAAYGFSISAESAYPIVFGTNNTERVRIGASGGLAIQQGLSVGTPTLYLSSIFFASAVLSAGAGSFALRWNSSTGIVTYDTSSRLVKENIEDSPYGLAEVLQLKSRKYHRTDDQRDEIGLVADEVQTVMPEFVPLVAKSIFTKDEADTEMIAGGVNYDKLTSVLIKAIQEQQAIIQTLTDRITALEGAK